MGTERNNRWAAELLRAEIITTKREAAYLSNEMEKYFIGDREYKELYKKKKQLLDEAASKEKMINRLI